ncbi:DUF354 domain-containing protein [Halomarina ordinaria]|uniref:DUF354 domain-containing protein n=1 Tax=Halomarina ordinaria TaxID=3033939 RepID=A0ABD5UD76_9EURY|nr:DUF354 domain-containing protein [Halomarina sp. PSRA2]
MRVLFDVTHPAHVHLFRHAIAILRAGDHDVRVTSRRKDLTTELLDAYDIAHVPLSTRGEGVVSLGAEWLAREARLFARGWRFGPDVVVSHLNPAAAHLAALTGARGVVFNDQEVAGPVARGTYPFVAVVCTPERFTQDLGSKHRRYRGFHELAYLHPDRFTPRPDLLRAHGVAPNGRFFVCRFVSMDAHHDVGQEGISPAAKRRLVEYLATKGTVFVSSEGNRGLEGVDGAAATPVPPSDVHHLLAFADLYVGDSGTMATEAAVLGTPALRCSSFVGPDDMSNFVELETEYGLLVNVADESSLFSELHRLTDDLDATGWAWRERRCRLLAEKIDVTAFVVETILGEGDPRRGERTEPATVGGRREDHE